MDWTIKQSCLKKEFKFNDFVSAIEFVNKIVPIAEGMKHHPDILVYSYNKVIVMLSTHEENKVTDKDYLLAKKIDELS